MRKRITHSFVTIENGSAYEELKQLNMLPSHKQLVLASIFDSVDIELTQVQSDLLAVYDVVEKDIDTENEQMSKVELQLKKSLKRVDHMYRKTVESRAANEKYESSKIIDIFCKSAGSLHETAKGIDAAIDVILENMSKVDSRFPEKSRLLNDQVFNEHHYPLSYELMRKKCPRAFTKDANVTMLSVSESCEGKPTSSSDADLHLELDTIHKTKINDEQIAKSIEDTISSYRDSKALRQNYKPPLNSVPDFFIPPSLKETSSPITSTTLETINAKGFFRAESSKAAKDDQ